MHVDLPSGQTVELRDKLKARDRFAMQAAIRVNVDADGGLQDTSGSVMNDMRNALLTTLIQSWTVTDENGAAVPIPKDAPADPVTGERQDVFGEMDIDDYNALADAVEPMVRKVLNVPNRSARSGS